MVSGDPELGGSAEYLEVVDLSYRPLSDVDPQIDEEARRRFLDAFFDASNLDPDRRSEANRLLSIDTATAGTGELVVRTTFQVCGSTRWDVVEDRSTVLDCVEEEGTQLGEGIAIDQRHGPTGWESSPPS